MLFSIHLAVMINLLFAYVLHAKRDTSMAVKRKRTHKFIEIGAFLTRMVVNQVGISFGKNHILVC